MFPHSGQRRIEGTGTFFTMVDQIRFCGIGGTRSEESLKGKKGERIRIRIRFIGIVCSHLDKEFDSGLKVSRFLCFFSSSTTIQSARRADKSIIKTSRKKGNI